MKTSLLILLLSACAAMAGPYRTLIRSSQPVGNPSNTIIVPAGRTVIVKTFIMNDVNNPQNPPIPARLWVGPVPDGANGVGSILVATARRENEAEHPEVTIAGPAKLTLYVDQNSQAVLTYEYR